MSSASSADRAASAASAAARACAVVTCRMSHLMSGSAGGATDRVSYPRPSKRNAESGSDAISPQTLAGLLAARDASATSLSRRRTLGSCGVKRSARRRRELVATQIVGPYHHRLPGERLADMTEIVGLGLLIRQLTMPRDQEFRSKQAHPLGPVGLGRGDLFGEIHVPAQGDADTVDGHRWLRDGLFEPRGELAPAGIPPLCLRHLVGCRIDQHRAASSVENDLGAGPDARDGAAQSEDRRNPDRVRENRRVGGARALFTDQPDDHVAVELHRQPGRQLAGDENRWLGQSFPNVRAGSLVHEMLDDADGHTGQIGEPLLEQRIARASPQITDLERLELERLLGGQVILADQLLDAANELLVLEHEGLRVEDARLVDAGSIHRADAKLGELFLDVFDGGAQTSDLFLHLRARDDAMRNLRQRPADRHGRPHGDAGRDADAFQEAIGRAHSFSLAGAFKCISWKPAATSSSNAAIACSASSPFVLIRIDDPHSAASVIMPRMLFPFTTAPSLCTSTVDLNLLATLTNSAPGRTCIPSGFTIWASRSITAISTRRRALQPTAPAPSVGHSTGHCANAAPGTPAPPSPPRPAGPSVGTDPPGSEPRASGQSPRRTPWPDRAAPTLSAASGCAVPRSRARRMSIRR